MVITKIVNTLGILLILSLPALSTPALGLFRCLSHYHVGGHFLGSRKSV